MANANITNLPAKLETEFPDLGKISESRAPIEERLQKALDKFLYGGGWPGAQRLRNFLNGTWLGEPLHVVLTDLPIGCWTAAMVFDLMDLLGGEREFAKAADVLVGTILIPSSRKWQRRWPAACE